MAITVRISDMLKQQVHAYARDLGISVNALVAVALRDYLDSRVPRERSPDSAVMARSTPASALQIVNPGTEGVAVNRAARRAKKR